MNFTKIIVNRVTFPKTAMDLVQELERYKGRTKIQLIKEHSDFDEPLGWTTLKAAEKGDIQIFQYGRARDAINYIKYELKTGELIHELLDSDIENVENYINNNTIIKFIKAHSECLIAFGRITSEVERIEASQELDWKGRDYATIADLQWLKKPIRVTGPSKSKLINDRLFSNLNTNRIWYNNSTYEQFHSIILKQFDSSIPSWLPQKIEVVKKAVEKAFIKKSRITHFVAKNAGIFQDVNIVFNKGFNFIIGPNASGKTLLLKMINLCLSSEKDEDSINLTKKASFFIVCEVDNQNIAFAFTHNCVTSRDKEKYNLREVFTPYEITSSKFPFSPLFIGAYRRFSKEDLIGNDSNDYEPKYFEDAGITNIEKWFIDKEFALKRFKKNGGIIRKNWEKIVKNLPVFFPKEYNFRFEGIHEEKWSTYGEIPEFSINTVKIPIHGLPAGFQAVLTLIINILDWIENNNKNEYRSIKKAVGTVLIDELGVHLHPKWQLIIRDKLVNLFPKMQFITTTHSPHIVSRAQKNEVIILPPYDESKGIYKIKPIKGVFWGWEIDDILLNLMGVETLESVEKIMLRNEGEKAIIQKDKQKLKEVLTKLKKITYPTDVTLWIFERQLELLKNENGEKMND